MEDVVKPNIKEMTDVTLIRVAGQHFSKCKEITNIMKGTAAKSGGQEFILGMIVAETQQDIHAACDYGKELLVELEERLSKPKPV